MTIAIVSLSSYVPMQGCTCDNQLLNLLPMVGASSAQINFGKSFCLFMKDTTFCHLGCSLTAFM